jgi:putative peptidoglycan lipid II flippase
VLATPLGTVGIALSSSISGWLNVVLLAIVLRRREHWQPDARLLSRTWRITVAAIGMSVALWFGLMALKAPLAHPNLMGVAALAGIVVLGSAVYGLLGMALGVIRLGELRTALRRPAKPDAPDAPP